MNKRAKKLILTTLQWVIAIVGIWIVVSNMSMRDSILLLNPASNTVKPTVLAKHADEDATQFDVVDPDSKQTITVDRSRLINPPTEKTVKVRDASGGQAVPLLGMRLRGDINQNPDVEELLIEQPDKQGKWISPTEVDGGFVLNSPRPRVTVGIKSMVQRARLDYLVLSIVVFPITFMITSFRWHRLLQALDVQMGLMRATVINMVGAFFNTFLPGSSSGDVIKAFYASRQTPHRMRAVISVLFDRVLGLITLIMVGGTMAAYQYLQSPSGDDPTARACLRVALACGGLLVAAVVGMTVLFQPKIRSMLGLEFILDRLPMQKQVNNAREVTRIYRRRPLLIVWALLITVPVHLTVIISAMLAGMAFGLRIQPLYYFTVVPVVVLVGSIPISPQGAGVMEAFAYLLTKAQGATVNEAVALTMSIRMVQILWNLTGGIFVLRGGYHAPTESEQKELEDTGQGPGQGDKETGGQGEGIVA